MDGLIAQFPAQLREALDIGLSANITDHTEPINNILISGMGGSAIGGNIVAGFVRDECKLPIYISKAYHIPQFVGPNTLAIVSSYSGNTEETLSSFQQILKSGAKVVVVSSGGKLIEEAQINSLDYIQVPAGSPSPRACLGYSMVQLMCILHKLDFISGELIEQLRKASDLINFDMDDIKSRSKALADKIQTKLPIIYSTDLYEPIALRWRQQINENAKMLCWHHCIPEMNHNELVGWKDENENLAVIYLRSEDDYQRNVRRIEINKEIISKYCDTIEDVVSKGKNRIERSIYLIHFGDWLSWYLSEYREMDAIEVDAIDYLKSSLANLNEDF